MVQRESKLPGNGTTTLNNIIRAYYEANRPVLITDLAPYDIANGDISRNHPFLLDIGVIALSEKNRKQITDHGRKLGEAIAKGHSGEISRKWRNVLDNYPRLQSVIKTIKFQTSLSKMELRANIIKAFDKNLPSPTAIKKKVDRTTIGANAVIELLVAAGYIKKGGKNYIHLDENLSEQALVNALGYLHPLIYEKCQGLYKISRYDEAVLVAYRTVEEKLREKAKLKKDDVGKSLIDLALNPTKPIIIINEVRAEQESLFFLFKGAIGVLKNPKSHRSTDYPDSNAAFECLSLASLLLQLLDNAKNSSQISEA